jgi:hypothetical protein
MTDLQDQFDQLLDMEEWIQIIVVFAAFMAGTVVRNVLEPNTPWDLPDEIYGVVVMFAGGYMPEYGREVMLGGGIYTADKLAERSGLKSRVTSVGA